MTHLISRYLVRPASSATAFIVMLLLIPFTIAMLLLVGLASLLVHRRLRDTLSTIRENSRQENSRQESNSHDGNRQQNNRRKQNKSEGLQTHKRDGKEKPPIEGNYTIVENK